MNRSDSQFPISSAQQVVVWAAGECRVLQFMSCEVAEAPGSSCFSLVKDIILEFLGMARFAYCWPVLDFTEKIFTLASSRTHTT